MRRRIGARRYILYLCNRIWQLNVKQFWRKYGTFLSYYLVNHFLNKEISFIAVAGLGK